MDYFALEVGGKDLKLPSYIPTGGIGNLEILMQRFMVVFLFIGVCLVVIYIVWGGLQWTMAQGDKQKLTAAKSKVSWAIIGFIILLLSYAIVGAIGFLFRVNLLDIKPV